MTRAKLARTIKRQSGTLAVRSWPLILESIEMIEINQAFLSPFLQINIFWVLKITRIHFHVYRFCSMVRSVKNFVLNEVLNILYYIRRNTYQTKLESVKYLIYIFKSASLQQGLARLLHNTRKRNHWWLTSK